MQGAARRPFLLTSPTRTLWPLHRTIKIQLRTPTFQVPPGWRIFSGKEMESFPQPSHGQRLVVCLPRVVSACSLFTSSVTRLFSEVRLPHTPLRFLPLLMSFLLVAFFRYLLSFHEWSEPHTAQEDQGSRIANRITPRSKAGSTR